MPDLLLNRVRTFLLHSGIWHNDRLIVVAVSGGPDSLCLLHLLWRLHVEGGPALHVAHLDHGLRGAVSAAEADFVAQTASAWGLPASIERYDVAASARRRHQNRQAAARAARYAFLSRIAQYYGAAAVAVAHHADDQAETLLLHLLYGAGPAGLRGMRAVLPWDQWQGYGDVDAEEAELQHCPVAGLHAPLLIRPLLDSTRAEIDAYCAEQRLDPRYDQSNSARYYTRNRIRADLLPHLASYNPQIVTALSRTAHICADDYAFIQAQLDAQWPALAQEYPGSIAFERSYWLALPPALQRYALRRAAQQLTGSDALSYEQVEAGRMVAQQSAHCSHSLGRGLLLQVTPQYLFIGASHNLRKLEHDVAQQQVPQLAVETLTLPVPGTTPLSGPWHVEVRSTAPPLPSDSAARRWWISIDQEQLDGPLLLRRRQAGDRFRPAGGQGSRLVQDFFVDQKIPRSLRNAWPILATPTSIVWIAGLRVDARFQATAATKHTLWIGITAAEPFDIHHDTQHEEQAMHKDIDRVLISAEELQAKVRTLGQQISRDYTDADNLIMVGVLKGCIMFMVDLARAIDLPLSIDFIAISSYGKSTESSGVVRLLKDLDTDIAGRHVLIVEDIIDSGLTLAYLIGQLARRGPASLRICTLLNKPERRTADVSIDYLGFDIPNEFVVGYGLDYGERYRNLPYIGVLKPEVYSRSTE